MGLIFYWLMMMRQIVVGQKCLKHMHMIVGRIAKYFWNVND